MNHHTAARFDTVLTAALGLATSWALADLVRRYCNGVEQLDDLRPSVAPDLTPPSSKHSPTMQTALLSVDYSS